MAVQGGRFVLVFGLPSQVQATTNHLSPNFPVKRAPAQVAANPAAMFDQQLLPGNSGGSGEAVSFTQRYAQSLGINAGGYQRGADPGGESMHTRRGVAWGIAGTGSVAQCAWTTRHGFGCRAAQG